jgi:hypothetical protein
MFPMVDEASEVEGWRSAHRIERRVPSAEVVHLCHLVGFHFQRKFSASSRNMSDSEHEETATPAESGSAPESRSTKMDVLRKRMVRLYSSQSDPT